jgi:hypothetical protein
VPATWAAWAKDAVNRRPKIAARKASKVDFISFGIPVKSFLFGFSITSKKQLRVLRPGMPQRTSASGGLKRNALPSCLLQMVDLRQ